MNCREAQHQLFAERDGAPDNSGRAALDGHVAQCADCRRIRDELAAAFTAWRTENQKVTVPDAAREWHAIRRKIRGGVEAGAEVRLTPWRSPFLSWVTIPVGAAAALAIALALAPGNRSGNAGEIARAEFVDALDNKSSTMVVVDQKTGWLFVMSSDASSHQGDE